MALTQQQRQEALGLSDKINLSEIHFADSAERIIDAWMLGNSGNEMPGDFLQGLVCRCNEPQRWSFILAELQRRYTDWEISTLSRRTRNGFPDTLIFKPKK